MNYHAGKKKQSVSLVRFLAQPSWAFPVMWGVEVIMSQWLFICMNRQHNLPTIVTHTQHLCIDTDRGNCDGSQKWQTPACPGLNTTIQMKEHFQIAWNGVNSPVNLTYIIMDGLWFQIWLKSTPDWLPIILRKVRLKK